MNGLVPCPGFFTGSPQDSQSALEWDTGGHGGPPLQEKSTARDGTLGAGPCLQRFLEFARFSPR